jgi:hypothetical protein
MSDNIPITFKVEPDALFLAMSEENMRLRARVEVLEAALLYYADDSYNGKNTDGSCARAALEATP